MSDDLEVVSLEACRKAPDGVHLWVRRREGTWCAYCASCRFGVQLSDDERERLQRLRQDKT